MSILGHPSNAGRAVTRGLPIRAQTFTAGANPVPIHGAYRRCMPVSVPPDPTLIEILSSVLLFLAASLPVAIGITLAVVAEPGGTVAARVRTLAVPASVLLVVTTAVQVWTARSTSTAQIAMDAVAVLGLAALCSRPSRGLAAVTALAGAGAALLPVMPSSLAAAPRGVLTSVHVLGALVWVGGLVVLAVAGLLSRRAGAQRPDAVHDWAQSWERFSVLALWAVGAMIVSGTWLAWTHVGSPAQLVTTPYGRHLTIKLVLVGLLLAAGAYNTRVLLPRIRAARGDGDARMMLRLAVDHFPAVVAAESVIAVAVLAVVPFLRGSARGQAGGAAAGPFDLTVFGCGAVLVAITAAALWAGTRVPPRKPAPHPTSAAPRPPAPDAATERRDPGRTGSARP